jgi:hypothetical protein
VIAWIVAAAWASPVEGRALEKGTGLPIPGAVVTLPDGAEVPVGPDGRFTVDLPDGVEARLQIQADGWDALWVSVTPPLDKPLQAWMLPADAPLEVVIEAFRPTGDLSRHRVDAEMAYETPGTYDDAVRLVQSQPGVVVQREFSPSSGDITVRGSQPGDNRYYFDGIEVPYLYHFNQYASVLPASQLASLDLYPSTFGAQLGDSNGAIVEAVSKAERPEKVSGSVAFNLVMVGADLRIPIPKKRWWVSVSGRRSYQDLAGESSLQYPSWPTFYDVSARAQHDGEHTQTSIWLAGAGDKYGRAVGELDVLDPVDQLRAPALSFNRNWQILGVQHRFKAGRVVTGILHDDQTAEVNQGGRQDVRTLGVPTRLDLTLHPAEWTSIDVGAELKPELTWVDVASAGAYGPLVVREAPAMAWDVSKTQAANFRFRGAAYATWNTKTGPVRMMPGLRVGLDTLGMAPTIEPRFAVKWRVAEQTELRFATGRYQQRPETLQLLVDPSLPTTDSWQMGAGIDQTIAGRLEIGLEGFYKASQNVLFQPLSGRVQVWDRGQTFGGELVMRYRLRETFFLWANLTVGRSFVFDAALAGDRAVPTLADQPVAGGFVASWNITRPLNVALRWRASSGLPWTNILGSTYDATQDTWQPRFGPPNAERMPFYQKIDLHVGYTFTFKRWTLDTTADLWIVPKSSAALYPTWNYDYTAQGYVIGPQVLPLVGLRAGF